MTGNSSIIFNYSSSDQATLCNLGLQLKQMRLNKNLTQQELSDLSGVSRSVISTMENKGLGTMSSFIPILRALEKLEILNNFITEAQISPIQIAKLKGKTRKRASSSTRYRSEEESEW